ncbi:hypothetical protein PM082_011603 [Marasmius tenuissimus]|nr:hypothetical protein PM082_011603 [Marasmius tenuissimus]
MMNDWLKGNDFSVIDTPSNDCSTTMVQTRSQTARARARAQQTDQPIINQNPAISSTATSRTRSSPRKRTSASTPKPKPKATAAKKAPASGGKGKAKAKVQSGRKASQKLPRQAPQPAVSTPERPSMRAWPQTPRAPRKSDAPALKPDFPSHLTSSPHASTYGTPLVMSLGDMAELTDTPTPTPAPTPTSRQRVRFDVNNLVLVPPLEVAEEDNDASTVILNEPQRHSTPRYLSARDLVASIPGNWVRSPGESSQRLVIVHEDTSVEAGRATEGTSQARINEIFQEQYERLIRDRDECMSRHRETVRSNGGLQREDAMIL